MRRRSVVRERLGIGAVREDRRDLVRRARPPEASGRSVFPHLPGQAFFGPNTMLCTSLGDLFKNVTVVPAFTDSVFGK